MSMAASLEARERSVEDGSISNQKVVADTGRWRQWTTRSVAAISLVTGLYLVLSLGIGWSRISAALQLFFESGAVFQIVGLAVLGLALRAARWQYYGARLGWRVPLGPSLLAFLASFAFTVTPGKAGEVVKSALLRVRYDVPVAQSAGALVVERLTDLIAVVILAMGGVTVFSGWQTCMAISFCVLSVGFLVLSQPRMYEGLLRLATRVRRLEPVARRVFQMLATTRKLLRPGPLVVGLAIALLAWGAEAVSLKVLTEALVPSLGLSLWLTGSLFGLATLVGALSLLPGGVGSFEAVLVLLLIQLGAPALDATVVALVFRLCTLWLGSMIGLSCMVLWWWLMVPRSAADRAWRD